MKNTKRFMALLLTLVLVFGSMSSAFAAVNEDVVDTDYEVAVTKLNAVGIMEGYPDGTFRPEGQITRAEFAKIAVLALGLNDAAEVSKANTIFTDVDAFHWAAGYINVAVDRGILKGYPDGTYKPSNPLSNAEAITILTRLIGLGPVVDKEGNWPANYITRANLEGVLDKVNVSSNAMATRGNAAKMLVNTLTITKWGARGYEYDGSVQYGPLAGDTLLTVNLNIDEYSVVVEDYDVDDNEIKTDEGTFELATGLDFYHLYLNEADVWVNEDDEVIFADITSDYFLDAVEFDGDELKLVTADKKYDMHKDAEVAVNGGNFDEYFDNDGDAEAAYDGKTYALGKVVLNDKNDVVFVDLYTFEDIFVAEKLDKDDDQVVIAVDGEEFDLDGYTIFKDGMLIATTDIEENDVVFFNDDDEFAEVYNNSVKGEIENVYSDAIEVDDEDYEYTATVVDAGVSYYLDGDDFLVFDEDAAEDMEAAEEDVMLFLDRTGELVFVNGDLGEADTNTVAGILLEDVEYDTSFGRTYAEFVFVNEEGTKVTETVKLTDLDAINAVDSADDDDDVSSEAEVVAANDGNALRSGQVVEFVYDEDGDIVELTFVDSRTFNSEIEVGDDYVDGNKITSSVVVFAVDGWKAFNPGESVDKDDVTVLEWSEDNFDDIAEGTYYFESDKVLYVVTEEVGDDTSDVNAVVDSFRLNTDDEVVRVTAWSTAGKNTYRADSIKKATTEGALFVLTIDDETDEVLEINSIDADKLEAGETLASVDVSDREFNVDGRAATLKLVSDYIILDATDASDIDDINLRDLKDLLDDGAVEIDVVLDAANSNYVQMVIVRDVIK
ncbi:S-layer homology domain-containing protein [Vallitaleaceae bacterium 9-2]